MPPDQSEASRRLISYLVPAFLAVVVTAVVDVLIIVPLVEIDPGLQIISRAGPALVVVRRILPTAAPVVFILVTFFLYSRRLVHGFALSPTDVETRRLVLRAPRVFGSFVAGGWGVAFLFAAGMDVVLVSFGSPGEAVAYYGSSAVAMLSTGVFGFLVTYLAIEAGNRRFLIPLSFPEGGVSYNRSVRPVTLSQRLLLLWFGVSFFPLMVLGLGIYTQRYLPENEFRAFLFAGLFVPISLLLVLRVGRSMEQPLHRLVAATERISDGIYDLQLYSQENDDLGYLTDATGTMARSLAEKERMRELFGRVVDPRVRDVLLSGELDTAGARRVAAIMFCDIRGFTTFSEAHGEEVVVRVLNEHLTVMERVVQEHGGMINKFLGDGFLALFGLPLERQDPAGDAYRCARALVAANDRLNGRRRERGDAELAIGVGIHYGALVAGTIGSDSRSEYTVIGDAVNLASRIEGLTKRLGTPIVATDDLIRAMGAPETVRDHVAADSGEDNADAPRVSTPSAGMPDADALHQDFGELEIRGRNGTVRLWGIRA